MDATDQVDENPVPANVPECIPRKKGVLSLQWNSQANRPLEARIAQSRKKRNVRNGDPKQLYLDFGQKNFDSKVCSVCQMMYCPGLPQEETLHRRFHMTFTHGVEFRGWKDERVVASFEGGDRIVCVYSTDDPAHRRKAEEVRPSCSDSCVATSSMPSTLHLDSLSSMVILCVVFFRFGYVARQSPAPSPLLSPLPLLRSS